MATAKKKSPKSKDYSLVSKRNGRWAVRKKGGKLLSGEEKFKILIAEGKMKEQKKKEEAPAAETPAAEESQEKSAAPAQ